VVEDMEDDPNFRNNIDILINKISSW
jgi:hypothetical protein